MLNFKLSDKVFSIRGEKAANFLHGQLTNTVKALPIGFGNFSCLLNQKGKIQATCFVINRESDFLLIAEATHAQILYDHLQKLAPLSRVIIESLNDWTVLHRLDPSSGTANEEALKPYQWQLPSSGTGDIVFRSDRLGSPGCDIITQNESLESVASEHEWEILRIRNGIPKFDHEITDNTLPQEVGLDHALHFEKGCYLGQEIIARLHFRGHVSRVLHKFSAASPLSMGTPVILANEEVGQLTSVIQDHDGNWLALGFIKWGCTIEKIW